MTLESEARDLLAGEWLTVKECAVRRRRAPIKTWYRLSDLWWGIPLLIALRVWQLWMV